jgi:pilus assembly protein CpaF
MARLFRKILGGDDSNPAHAEPRQAAKRTPGTTVIVPVYVCSAFHDMSAERAHLHEAVFPVLSERFADQGIEFDFVDFPCGASSEAEAENPATLLPRLEEIDRCRPFFVGLLGELYGAPLDPIPEAALAKYSWLEQYAGFSLLHLEILHGVLRDSIEATQSFFYARDPNVLADLPAGSWDTYIEADERVVQKFKTLKKAIRNSGRPVRKYGARWDAERAAFAELAAFGDLVLRDLSAAFASTLENEQPPHRHAHAQAPDATLTVKGNSSSQTYPMQQETLLLGRSGECHVLLDDPWTSRRHAQIVRIDGRFYMEDLGSTAGTLVNGKTIPANARVPLQTGDEIGIGSFVCLFEQRAGDEPLEPEIAPTSRVDIDELLQESAAASPGSRANIAPADAAPLESAELTPFDSVPPGGVSAATPQENVPAVSGEWELPPELSAPEAAPVARTVPSRTDDKIRPGRWPADLSEERQPAERPAEMASRTAENADGGSPFGPLEPLLKDPDVSDVFVNGPHRVYVRRRGKVERTRIEFSDVDHLVQLIGGLLRKTARGNERPSPLVNARLADDLRINAIMPPLAIDGPTMHIQRTGLGPLTVEDLLREQSLALEMAQFLQAAVKAELNIVVCGGSGSGKTTVLNALGSFIPREDRVVTIETAPELRLAQETVVRLVCPSSSRSDSPALRDLVQSALRLSPQWLVVGECRGPEALDVVHAMSGGESSCMTAVRAHSGAEAPARIETMLRLADSHLREQQVRQEIISAIDLVIHVSRLRGGLRKICAISEITGCDGDVYGSQDLFRFKQLGIAADGRMRGQFMTTGVKPRCLPRILAAGEELPERLFDVRILLET